MRNTSLRRRLLCWLGLHVWRSFTCQDGYEARGCRDCAVMQRRIVDVRGNPIGPWMPLDPDESA